MGHMVHLHHHSTFSWLDGYGTPDQIMDRIVELDQDTCAITDHGNVVGHVPWQKAAKKFGIKPIYGCEFYIVDNMRERTKIQPTLGASAIPHLTVLAHNEVGYRNLLRLNRVSYEEGFYYKNRIDWDELLKHQEGLIVLSGCVGGYPSRLLETKGAEACYDFLDKLSQRLDYLFVELIPEPGLGPSHATLEPLVKVAQALQLPMVLTADAHFPRPEDHPVQDIMLAVGTGQRVNQEDRALQLPAYQHTTGASELMDRARLVAPNVPDRVWVDAIRNTREIGDFCSLEELPRASKVVFAGYSPDKYPSTEEMLEHWIWDGLQDRINQGLIKEDDWWRELKQSKTSLTGLLSKIHENAGNGPVALDQKDTVKSRLTASPSQSTDSSINTLSNQSQKDLKSTTSAETTPAVTQTTSSRPRGKKIFSAVHVVQPSTTPKPTVSEDIRSKEKTSTLTPTVVDSVGSVLASAKDYAVRASYEFQVLKRKQFCDYILAVADVCRHIKSLGSLTMCRGSAGGCLLLWLIGASETDSLKHGLSFQRFYDDNRPDPPDVDVDFEQAYRQAAIDYIYDCYGKANCSQIAALSKLKAKGALQDACRALGIQRVEYAALSSALDAQDEDMDRQLEEVTDPKARAVLDRYPALEGFIRRMVGQYRQTSIHAAGVLVSNHPLHDVIGVVRGNDGQVVAAIDKKGAAELGFLKMDFLSVRGLDVVANTVRKLGQPMSWLTTLPLDDRQALAIGDAGMLAGVFQLDGGAAGRVSRQIGLTSFDDVAAAGALCRPGPGGWVETYKNHKDNPDEFAAYLKAMHPVAREIVKETYGILLYQEQVMHLARYLAGLEWPEVHQLRKGVADKAGLNPMTGDAWRAEWKTKFVGGCTGLGVHPTEAEFWWQSIQSHGGYSFNKSHCYTYGIIGYWMLFLKAHHPDAFYSAYLQLEDKEITIKRLIFEYRRLGGRVDLLDPAHSRETFSAPEAGRIVGGYQNLKGIGPKIASTLVKQGPFKSWEELLGTLGGSNAERIRATGCLSGEWSVQDLIVLAPWFPVPRTGAKEAAAKQEYGLMGTRDLPIGPPMDGDAFVAGYVTAAHVEQEKYIFMLEDEDGAIVFRVPYRYAKELGPKFAELKLADYVAVTGWWAGDVLYSKDVVVISSWPGHMFEPVKKKSSKDAKRDLVASLPDLPDF